MTDRPFVMQPGDVAATLVLAHTSVMLVHESGLKIIEIPTTTISRERFVSWDELDELRRKVTLGAQHIEGRQRSESGYVPFQDSEAREEDDG